MTELVIDKEAGHVVLIEDGRRRSYSIRGEDTVISVPPSGFKKITNIYVEPDSGKLVVIHEE